MTAGNRHNPSVGDRTGHWTILGAGAIGCLWAASLRQAGFPVTLLTRAQPPRQSVTLVSGGDHQHYTVDACSVADFINRGIAPSLLLVTTKAHQTRDALKSIDTLINSDTTLVVLQNGLAAREVAARYPRNAVVAGITTDGAWCSEPLTVILSGSGATWLGRYDGLDCRSLLPLLPLDVRHIECCDDIELRQWLKLASNCAINGLTAIYQCRNGDLLDNVEARQRMQAICTEIQAVARALQLPAQAFVDIFDTALHTAQATAQNYSSMYQDIRHHRHTEIDALNGFICREAQRLGVPCLENARIVAAVRQLESH